jgi:hypothetical protein
MQYGSNHQSQNCNQWLQQHSSIQGEKLGSRSSNRGQINLAYLIMFALNARKRKLLKVGIEFESLRASLIESLQHLPPLEKFTVFRTLL